MLAAAPDFALAALYLITWISPGALQEKMVSTLMFTMVLEFIIMHSSAFMGNVMIADRSREQKAVALVGWGAFYTLFVGGFAITFKTWWPLVNFWGLTVNRLLSVLLGQAPSGDEKGFLQRSWAASGIFYLVFCFVTLLLPLPRLGITREVARSLDLPGSGVWVDQPHRVIAFGFLYFLATAISELVGHAWLSGGIPQKPGAGAQRGLIDPAAGRAP